MASIQNYKDSITIRLPDLSPNVQYIYIIDFVASMLENDSMVEDYAYQCVCAYAKERFAHITRNV